MFTNPVTIAQTLASLYRGRPTQRAATIAPDALDGQVVADAVADAVAERERGPWYHGIDADVVMSHPTSGHDVVAEESPTRGRSREYGTGYREHGAPLASDVYDVVLGQPLYQRQLSPLSAMDCDTAALDDHIHAPPATREVPSTEIYDIVASRPIYSPREPEPAPSTQSSPLPEGLDPWQWYLPNDPRYQEAPPRDGRSHVPRRDPIDRLCEQVLGLAEVIRTDRQQLRGQIQGLVDAVQSDRLRVQDQIEALEQRPIREADGTRRKGSKPKRTSNPKRRPADTVLLAVSCRIWSQAICDFNTLC